MSTQSEIDERAEAYRPGDNEASPIFSWICRDEGCDEPGRWPHGLCATHHDAKWQGYQRIVEPVDDAEPVLPLEFDFVTGDLK